MPLLLRDQPRVVLLLNLRNFIFVASDNLVFLRWYHDVVLRDSYPRLGGEVETDFLESVKDRSHGWSTMLVHERCDHRVQITLAERLVGELEIFGIEFIAERPPQCVLNPFVENDATDGRKYVIPDYPLIHRNVVKLRSVGLVGKLRLLRRAHNMRTRLDLVRVHLCKLFLFGAVRKVVSPEHHILGG